MHTQYIVIYSSAVDLHMIQWFYDLFQTLILNLLYVKMDRCVCLGSRPIMGGWNYAEEVFGDLSASPTPSVSMMLQSSAGCLATSQIMHWVRSVTSTTNYNIYKHGCQLHGNYYAGSRVFSTTTTARNPPIFADFNCGANANNLSECRYPSGLTSNVYSCSSRVIGVQCARKCSVHIIIYLR